MYGFLPAYWRLGLATEAARAVLQYGFEHGLFTRVYGRTDVPNRASVLVLERLGMIFEKETLVDALPILIYSLTRPNQRSGANDIPVRAGLRDRGLLQAVEHACDEPRRGAQNTPLRS